MKANFDPQGKYFWHHVKLAGWDEERVNRLLISKYKVTHWNALDQRQKQAAISLMKRYAEKAAANRDKKLRQAAMAYAIKGLGWDKDYLHDMMVKWGYGDSLRALTTRQLRAVIQNMQAIVEDK